MRRTLPALPAVFSVDFQFRRRCNFRPPQRSRWVAAAGSCAPCAARGYWPEVFRFPFAVANQLNQLNLLDSNWIAGGSWPTCCCGEDPGDEGVIGEVGETEQGVVRPEVKPEFKPEGGLRRPSPIFEVVGNGAGTSGAAVAAAAATVSSSAFNSRRKFPLDVAAAGQSWSPRLRRLPARELFDVLWLANDVLDVLWLVKELLDDLKNKKWLTISKWITNRKPVAKRRKKKKKIPLTTPAGFTSTSGRFILFLDGTVLARAKIAALRFQCPAVPAQLLLQGRLLRRRRRTGWFAYGRKPLFQRCNLGRQHQRQH